MTDVRSRPLEGDVVGSVKGRVARPGRGMGGAEPVVLDAPGSARRKVRSSQLVVSAALLVASVLVGYLVVRSQSELVEVWVASERVEAGEVIEPADVVLREVDAGSTLSALAGSEVVVGRTVRVPVPAGAALVEGHFFDSTDGLAVAGAAQMSLVFDLGRITDSVARNDLLRIAVVPGQAGPLTIFDSVPVLAVSAGERSGFLVTIEVEVDVADELVAALADGEAWASVVGRR